MSNKRYSLEFDETEYQDIICSIDNNDPAAVFEVLRFLRSKIVDHKCYCCNDIIYGWHACPGRAKEEYFDVILEHPGSKLIPVIKCIREILGCDLLFAKNFVESSLRMPQIIKERISESEAKEIKEKFSKNSAKIKIVLHD